MYLGRGERPFGMVLRRGVTNKDLRTDNIEPENGRTVLPTTGQAPSEIVERKANNGNRRKGLSMAPQRLSP